MIFTEVNTFSSIVSSAFSGLSINKWRRDFLLEIFMLYLVIPGRINFKQMSRYSEYCEQRFRNQFKEKFDFIAFNTALISPIVGKRIALLLTQVTLINQEIKLLFWAISGLVLINAQRRVLRSLKSL